MGPLFQNRAEAGKFLAKKLAHHAIDPSVLVLALPRGGVPVAFEIAVELNAPLDIFIVRKLGVPGYQELALGSVASGGVRVLNEELIQRLNIPPAAIEVVAAEEEEELARGEQAFRGSREPASIDRRTVILVDDGLATGASMRAAVRALRLKHPSYVTVAVPIASRETCDQFRGEVDEVICGETPEPFYAVGAWYASFLPTSHEDVRHLLDRAAHERRAHRVQSQRSFAM